MSSHDALIVALPPSSAFLAAGGPADDDCHWWRVIDGQITQSGHKLDWLHPSRQGPLASETCVVALAPAADVVLHHAAFPHLTDRQALAAARLLAAEQSITPAHQLHIALSPPRLGQEGQRILAVCDDTLMAKWMGWLAEHGLVPDHIVPIPAVIPAPDSASPMTWVQATIAGETILRSADTAFVGESDLVTHILSGDGEVGQLDAGAIDRALLSAVDEPPVDLRTGPWAKSRPALMDRATLRRSAMLASAILLASAAILAAQIVRVHADTATINDRAVADVARVLRTPPPVEQTIPQLDARLAALGGGTGRLSAPFAALVASLEPSPAVAIDTLSWRGDGTLAVTLGAPRTEDINTVLIALQARGYVITATPRSGPDGRALGDITIRSGR